MYKVETLKDWIGADLDQQKIYNFDPINTQSRNLSSSWTGHFEQAL